MIDDCITGEGGGRGDHYMVPDPNRLFPYPDYGQPQSQQQPPPPPPPQQQQPQILPPLQQPQMNTNMGMTGGGHSRLTTIGEGAPPPPPPPPPASKTSPSTSTPVVTPPSGVRSHNNSNSSEVTGSATGVSHAQTPAHAAQNPLNKVAHASMTRLEVNLEELEMEAMEQDAQASGAVLALAMGVCITALLVVLVGCRLRGVRRRLRKQRGSRSPYSHDADYLVNGMYL
ncbi:Low-density lipoprotein receptor-related protein 11-like [Homarus americanus]|uniref:Low-density lipoprotein receptor-related protein 11-like n=1 Tax=Homarus americanus TaxID=6706 RepID=A0A8J5TIN6_HOMAM|nr:Low-density lipoprotein receptor-related protein 11-like [Homarus americanus]